MAFPSDMSESDESSSSSSESDAMSAESQSTSDAPSDMKKSSKPNPLRRWAQQ